MFTYHLMVDIKFYFSMRYVNIDSWLISHVLFESRKIKLHINHHVCEHRKFYLSMFNHDLMVDV